MEPHGCTKGIQYVSSDIIYWYEVTIVQIMSLYSSFNHLNECYSISETELWLRIYTRKEIKTIKMNEKWTILITEGNKKKYSKMILIKWLQDSSLLLSQCRNECLSGRCVSDKHHIALMCKNNEIILFWSCYARIKTTQLNCNFGLQSSLILTVLNSNS